MNKLLLILSIIILTVVDLIVSQNIKCENNTSAFDISVTDYFLFAAPYRKYPTNSKEFKTFCKDNPIQYSKIKLYAEKCMNKLMKRLASLMLYTIEKTNSNICRSRKRSKEFIKLGKCGNASNKDNKKCWQKWMNSINGVSTLKDNKLKIALICCSTYSMRSCFIQSYETNKKQCQQKSRDGLDNLLGSYITDTMKLICGDYTEDNDKCDKIIGKIPVLKNTKSLNNSPIALFMSIFDSIPEDAIN